MKKIIAATAAISLITLTLSGCAPGQNVPGATIVGAAAGGLLASQIGSGSVAGILAGSLIGGGLGYMAGKIMDSQDRANMQSAVVNTPVGQEASWTNARTNTTYVVQPVRNYRTSGRYCREYRTRINVGGTWRNAYGHACQMPDGQWKIVK